jgi:hypothetical protein
MTNTLRLLGGALLTSIRIGKPGYDIVLCRNDDLGVTWKRISDVTGDIGGNPPATILLPNDNILTVYYFNGPRAEDRSIEGTFWAPASVY